MTDSHFSTTSNDTKRGLLSVIIPVYNAAQYLGECLDSVCNQSYTNLEIICVDDGSTDESLEILKRYQAKDPRIIVLEQSNSGQAAARNHAMRFATGEFIAGLDSDDYLHTDCYKIAFDLITDQIDIVTFGIQPFIHDQTKRLINSPYYCRDHTGVIDINGETIKSFTYDCCNKIFRRSVIDKYQLHFPEGIWYEDLTFTQQYLAIINKAYQTNEKLYFYRIRHNSTMGKTRTKNAKAFDIIRSVDLIFQFYKDYNIWSKLLPQVEHLGKHVLKNLDAISDSYRLRSQIARYCWIRKWRLNVLFPDSEIFKLPNYDSIFDIIGQYARSRTALSTFASAAPHKLEQYTKPDFRVMEPSSSSKWQYYFWHFIPLFSVKEKYDRSKGTFNKRIRLFGILPLLSTKGSPNGVKYYIFNTVLVWQWKRSL